MHSVSNALIVLTIVHSAIIVVIIKQIKQNNCIFYAIHAFFRFKDAMHVLILIFAILVTIPIIYQLPMDNSQPASYANKVLTFVFHALL